ncbi:hypothetical protein PILCRDRAFT_8148 [Piloderma croceum F 1598]|uniref:O-methyltransferase domain-containing protein n=1 Tax=Piloderma croceum (strain F 1598) TaxID=765440 RepID=A0A0C3B7S2_PILCF|nr:hypothetical protein PILCRDRAFT_8148 [Piloderma croceum F 1598]
MQPLCPGIFGDALDDIECVFAEHPRPCSIIDITSAVGSLDASWPQTLPNANPPTSLSPKPSSHTALDFPSLDVSSQPPPEPAEHLIATSHIIGAAANRIVVACGQMSATVHDPFSSLCDASLWYHFLLCLEMTHTVEVLCEASSEGLHVSQIAERNSTELGKCAHILCLLLTHNIIWEVRPDVFMNNRINALLDSGNGNVELGAMECQEKIYEGTNSVAAFVGRRSAKYSTLPTQVSCNFAFGTGKGGVGKGDGSSGQGNNIQIGEPRKSYVWELHLGSSKQSSKLPLFPPRFELTTSSQIASLDWAALPAGSTIVNVGEGIGSTSMQLAKAFGHLKFVMQDRAPVIDMGVKSWINQYPEFIVYGRAKFQVHGFFTPQPILDASVFLRIPPSSLPLHYTDHEPLKAGIKTGMTLRITDNVLPLACVDDMDGGEGQQSAGVEGAERMLASPLLVNLGKSQMEVTFNAKEWPLREIVALEAEMPTITFGLSIDLPGGATGSSSSSASTTLSVDITDTGRRDGGRMIRNIYQRPTLIMRLAYQFDAAIGVKILMAGWAALVINAWDKCKDKRIRGP